MSARSHTAVDALLSFGMELAQLGHCRHVGDSIELEVPRELFLAVLAQGYDLGIARPSGKLLRLASAANHPENWAATFVASAEAPGRTHEVGLSEELIGDGLVVNVFGRPWVVRMKAADRAELLAAWKAHAL